MYATAHHRCGDSSDGALPTESCDSDGAIAAYRKGIALAPPDYGVLQPKRADLAGILVTRFERTQVAGRP